MVSKISIIWTETFLKRFKNVSDQHQQYERFIRFILFVCERSCRQGICGLKPTNHRPIRSVICPSIPYTLGKATKQVHIPYLTWIWEWELTLKLGNSQFCGKGRSYRNPKFPILWILLNFWTWLRKLFLKICSENRAVIFEKYTVL